MYQINWGSAADWAGAIGSVAAVVTALYLAGESRRIKLKGYCGIRSVLNNNSQREVIFLSVTNVGSRITVVNNIGIRTGLFRKRYGFVTFLRTGLSDGIPVEIADGKTAKWAIEDPKKWVHELCKGFVHSNLDARTFRFSVHTTLGTIKLIKPESNLLDIVLAEVKKGKVKNFPK